MGYIYLFRKRSEKKERKNNVSGMLAESTKFDVFLGKYFVCGARCIGARTS